ncbi:hypothetical protein BASA61_002835 [Batrachochytrium salamandrivorans]|nr:hypothetical protein BASA62_003897 [Batrachochytrium salamandrivorans]KAH6573736.1 hypothetical protein BASA60_005918 [Batrachochytrium salamandrivorans]KAH6598760.1 hypothetical protein BASA61_002835 [Batrachochytrium salamandrivorans]
MVAMSVLPVFRRMAARSTVSRLAVASLHSSTTAASASSGFTKITPLKPSTVVRRASSTPSAAAATTIDQSAFPSAVSFENELASDKPADEVQAFSDESPLSEDLSKSFKGVSYEPFPDHINQILSSDINHDDIEVKPDGMLYIPEIKYRRMLNKAFGPGGWGMVPRGPHTVNNKNISREYGLFCMGRFVSQARGEQDFFGEDSLPTASEGCKSNALIRCCKDLGIHWELWDPVFIRKYKAENAVMVQGTHVVNGTKKYLWRRKDRTLDYPYKEEGGAGKSSASSSLRR